MTSISLKSCNPKEPPQSFIDMRQSEMLKEILNLKSYDDAIPDWHSTHTFQVFLETLDVNHQKSRVKASKESLDSHVIQGIQDDTRNNIASEQTSPSMPKSKTAETILSAQALKIMSEQPNLSQMTGSRSFIFPSAKTEKNPGVKKR